MKKKYSPAQLKAIRYQYWLRSQEVKKLKATKPKHSFKLNGSKSSLKSIKKVDAFEKLVDEHKRNRTYQIKSTAKYHGNYKDRINFVYDNAKERDHIIATAKRAGYIPLKVWDSDYDKESSLSYDMTPRATMFIKAKSEQEAIELFNKTKASKDFPIIDKDPSKALAQQIKLERELRRRNAEYDRQDREYYAQR